MEPEKDQLNGTSKDLGRDCDLELERILTVKNLGWNCKKYQFRKEIGMELEWNIKGSGMRLGSLQSA